MLASNMDANVVFQVVNALSIEEQQKLLSKLNEKFSPKLSNKKSKKFSQVEATRFLLKTVFHKNSALK